MVQGKALVDLLLRVHLVLGKAAIPEVLEDDEALLLVRGNGDEPTALEEAPEDLGLERGQRLARGPGQVGLLLRPALHLVQHPAHLVKSVDLEGVLDVRAPRA